MANVNKKYSLKEVGKKLYVSQKPAKWSYPKSKGTNLYWIYHNSGMYGRFNVTEAKQFGQKIVIEKGGSVGLLKQIANLS